MSKKNKDGVTIGEASTHTLFKEQRELDERIRAAQGGFLPVNQSNKSGADVSGAGGVDLTEIEANHQKAIKTLEDGHAELIKQRDQRIAELEQKLEELQKAATAEPAPVPELVKEPDPSDAKPVKK